LLLPQKIRRDRKRASRQANQGPPSNLAQRFRKVFVNCFARWAGSWVCLWIAGIIYGLVTANPKVIGMVSLDGLMTLAILIALGTPLALLFAAAFCWFKDTDQNITGALSIRDQPEKD
jgi:hypothetical protein